ncbi:MAG: lipopolysaccharide biosynthesis protein [Planctomycetes bacterium]|nr:lipopolysaccharide biosynthesis protein [Planctomycetota bacterium]
MEVSRSVRTTLIALAVGSVLQRLGQLVAIVWLCHALGPMGAGRWAMGLAVGNLLAVLAGTGLRSHIARAIAREPAAAGTWLCAAIRSRLWLGAIFASVTTALALALADEPWFWAICALPALPAAFELRQLFDVVDRTRTEVAIEALAGLGFLLAVAIAVALDCREPTVYIACHLLARSAYAVAAAHLVARLPRCGTVPGTWQLIRTASGVAGAQTACEAVGSGEVWLIAALGGDDAAGLFAVAQRLVGAAALPSHQLTRLLLPHLFSAATDGDIGRTLRTALRATALATLPLAAGGFVMATPLCSLFGSQFAAAAPVLSLLLLATVLQHLGWQCSHAQFGCARDLAYARGLLLQAVLLVVGYAALVPQWHATGAGVVAVLAQALYLGFGMMTMGSRILADATAWLRPAALVAATTAIATAIAGAGNTPAGWRLFAQFAAGGGAFLLGLWLVELRQRGNRLGEGLVQASGFRR